MYLIYQNVYVIVGDAEMSKSIGSVFRGFNLNFQHSHWDI